MLRTEDWGLRIEGFGLASEDQGVENGDVFLFSAWRLVLKDAPYGAYYERSLQRLVRTPLPAISQNPDVARPRATKPSAGIGVDIRGVEG